MKTAFLLSSDSPPWKQTAASPPKENWVDEDGDYSDPLKYNENNKYKIWVLHSTTDWKYLACEQILFWCMYEFSVFIEDKEKLKLKLRT